MGDGGKGARRSGDPRRSALHAHERDGVEVGRRPRRLGHRLPRRDHQLHPRARPLVRGVREDVHERTGRDRREVRGHRGPRRVLLRLEPRAGAVRGARHRAVGWTQHTVGVQIIRAAAIIQLLLGNVGRPGGGVMALRGHASIQGSTDLATLFNILPGYLSMPQFDVEGGLKKYIESATAPAGWWGKADTFIVSLLKAWWGAAATKQNDFCFDYLPKIDEDHSEYWTFVQMLEGNVKGYLAVGENPAVGSTNGKLHRLGLAKLD